MIYEKIPFVIAHPDGLFLIYGDIIMIVENSRLLSPLTRDLVDSKYVKITITTPININAFLYVWSLINDVPEDVDRLSNMEMVGVWNVASLLLINNNLLSRWFVRLINNPSLGDKQLLVDIAAKVPIPTDEAEFQELLTKYYDRVPIESNPIGRNAPQIKSNELSTGPAIFIDNGNAVYGRIEFSKRARAWYFTEADSGISRLIEADEHGQIVYKDRRGFTPYGGKIVRVYRDSLATDHHILDSDLLTYQSSSTGTQFIFGGTSFRGHPGNLSKNSKLLSTLIKEYSFPIQVTDIKPSVEALLFVWLRINLSHTNINNMYMLKHENMMDLSLYKQAWDYYSFFGVQEDLTDYLIEALTDDLLSVDAETIDEKEKLERYKVIALIHDSQPKRLANALHGYVNNLDVGIFKLLGHVPSKAYLPMNNVPFNDVRYNVLIYFYGALDGFDWPDPTIFTGTYPTILKANGFAYGGVMVEYDDSDVVILINYDDKGQAYISKTELRGHVKVWREAIHPPIFFTKAVDDSIP